MDHTVIVTLLNVVFTPIVVLLTMWVKGGFEKDKRRDRRDDNFISALEDRVRKLEQRLDEKEKEIREIRVELKNRDEEYVNLFKEHTTLKAKYEVLSIDHEELKKLYEATAKELDLMKDNLLKNAEKTVERMHECG